MRWLFLIFAFACTPPVAATKSDVVGRAAPAWQVSRWFNSEPLSLAELRGKVVFVRWFTSPDCPFCTASAPALRALDERYAGNGLVVVGMYHHKSDTPLEEDEVAGWARHYGYDFAVGIDEGWKTLKAYWLDAKPRAYTSVSFVIDKRGMIREVHEGGTITDEDLARLSGMIEKLLAE